jgi:hypothetical protein
MSPPPKHDGAQRMLIFIAALVFSTPQFSSKSIWAQTKRPSPQQAEVSKLRLSELEHALGNKLYITVNSRERKISNQALDAWIINNSKEVVYSGLDGSGGFENEGQSLRIYDVSTRKTRKVLSEYTAVAALMEVKLSTGQLALLVKLVDGGLGGSYFAVVDPKRGEVLYRRWAELTEIKGDNITLAFYDADDWEEINDARDWKINDSDQVISRTKVKPQKIEKHDLKRVLRRRVIYNKRDR